MELFTQKNVGREIVRDTGLGRFMFLFGSFAFSTQISREE